MLYKPVVKCRAKLRNFVSPTNSFVRGRRDGWKEEGMVDSVKEIYECFLLRSIRFHTVSKGKELIGAQQASVHNNGRTQCFIMFISFFHFQNPVNQHEQLE